MKDKSHNTFEALQSLTQEIISKSSFNNPTQKKNISIRENTIISEFCLDIIRFSSNLALRYLNHPVFMHEDNFANTDRYLSSTTQLINGNLNWKSYNGKIQKILKSFLIQEVYNSLPIKSFIKEFYYSYSKSFLPNQYSFDLITDHLKITSAITNSIYCETINNNLHFLDYYSNSASSLKIGTKIFPSQLLVVRCQLVGVRNYISNYHNNFSIIDVFKITKYFVSLSSVIKNYCLRYFELTDANTLFNFTNSFSFLLPGSFKKDLNDCILYINTVLAQVFNGYIFFSCAHESISFDELDDIKCKWNKLTEHHEHNINNMFRDINYKSIFKPFTKPEFDFSTKPGNIKTNFDANTLKRDYHNSNTKKRKYRNGNSVLKAFGYETTLQAKQNLQQRSNKLYDPNFNQNYKNINIKPSCFAAFNNYALMEVMFENPDNLINDLHFKQNLFTLIKHYKAQENTINIFLSESEEYSKYNTGYIKDVHIIYKSYHELILVGSLEKLINIAKNRYFNSDMDSVGSHQMPVFMNISFLNNNYSSSHLIQNSKLFTNKFKLNEKHANKIVLFNKELTIYEFCKTITLTELIVSIISTETVKDKKEIILKSLHKCSLKFGELVRNTTEGYLYFEEFYRFIYYISKIETISIDHRNSLISIIKEIVKNNLLRKEKTLNGSIITIACKIADIITRNK